MRILPHLLVLAATAHAGHEVTPPPRISGEVSVAFVSQYISRGYIFENQGAIAQPALDLSFPLYNGDGWLSSVSLDLGVWASVHSHPADTGLPAGARATRHWYEFDYTAGLTFGLGENWAVSPSLQAYFSPNSAYADFFGVQLLAEYDDSELLGAWALHPHAQVLFEIAGKYNGSGSSRGIYYEVGITPELPVGPITASFPVALGLGSGHFFESLDVRTGVLSEDTFGFVSVGINLDYPLAFIPAEFGEWTLSANATYIHLGDGTAAYNSPALGGNIREAQRNEWVFGGGLSVSF